MLEMQLFLTLLRADIRSIDFEIRLLSEAKTVLQHGKIGSSSRAVHSSRSQKESIDPTDSASSRLAGTCSSRRKLHDEDEGLQAVKRNLLSMYAENSEAATCSSNQV
jgi:hypothetical protein